MRSHRSWLAAVQRWDGDCCSLCFGIGQPARVEDLSSERVQVAQRSAARYSGGGGGDIFQSAMTKKSDVPRVYNSESVSQRGWIC